MEVNVEMTYKTKSCPYCGKIYTWMETANHHYGSPLRVCSQCNKTFIDKSYKELACNEYAIDEVYKVEPISIFSVIIGLIFIALSILQATAPEDEVMFILFLLFGILLLGAGCYFIKKDISTYPSRCKQLEREISLSRKRLSNPEYARKLHSLGFYVPREYLKMNNLNAKSPAKTASGSSSSEHPPFTLSDSAKYAITVFIVVSVALVFVFLLNTAFTLSQK